MKSKFIYEWLDLDTNLKYIGRHEGSIDDGYIGSGTVFREEFSKRPTDFVRKILWESVVATSEELCQKELEYLSQISDDELYFGSNRKYYNIVKNSYGYTSVDNPMRNPEVVAKMMATRELNGKTNNPWVNTVKKYGLEKAKQMRALSSEIAAENGRKNKGIPKSEEHKKKISDAVKTQIKNSNKKNKNLGRKPLTSAEELVMLYSKHETFSKAANAIGISEDAFKGRYYTALKKLKIR